VSSHTIVEEADSHSSSLDNNDLGEKKPMKEASKQKKPGLLSRVKMNLGKLSTKKSKGDDFAKDAGLNFMSLADDATYSLEPPKSARLRESAFPSFVMRHPAKGGAPCEPDQLYSIKEEH